MSLLVTRELAARPGITVTDSGFDGRSDFVLFEVERGSRDSALSLRTTEDVFVEVGRTLRTDGNKARWIADRIWRPSRVQRALSVWADEVRPLSSSMTFRVIARVLEEQSFLRTELRRQFTDVIRADKRKWRFGDPAQIEVWVTEYKRGGLIAGLRLTDAGMRQHDGRQVERPGALRPTVAAAMVALAGEAAGTLLDPCCGSGTILAEAFARGWEARGVDIDPGAVEAARLNAPHASVHIGDSRSLTLPDSAVAACVSNLPFGQQYEVQGDMADWLRAVLKEIVRVTTSRGQIIVLAPEIPRRSIPAELHIQDRYEIRLLGTRTTIWRFQRN